MLLSRKKGLFESTRVLFLPADAIAPNPNQPRKAFAQDGLEELAASIRLYGILQPLSVRKVESGYELVSGERRLRASQMAGLTQVPCILVNVDDEASSLLALIENLQRRDLDFVEEAAALAKLIRTFHLSQEEAAQKIGKSQSAVANKLRLLRLPPRCTGPAAGEALLRAARPRPPPSAHRRGAALRRPLCGGALPDRGPH